MMLRVGADERVVGAGLVAEPLDHRQRMRHEVVLRMPFRVSAHASTTLRARAAADRRGRRAAAPAAPRSSGSGGCASSTTATTKTTNAIRPPIARLDLTPSLDYGSRKATTVSPSRAAQESAAARRDRRRTACRRVPM